MVAGSTLGNSATSPRPWPKTGNNLGTFAQALWGNATSSWHDLGRFAGVLATFSADIVDIAQKVWPCCSGKLDRLVGRYWPNATTGFYDLAKAVWHSGASLNSLDLVQAIVDLGARASDFSAP